MPRPRIALFAYADVGHACLDALAANEANVVACYTHADAADERAWFPSVRRRAEALGIPVHGDADFARADARARLAAAAPELILSAYYRALLPPAVLAVPRLGAFNLHGSLLPRYRGRAPVNWAVLNGETETGATLHVMTPRADAGDIVDQAAVAIGPDDTAAQVQARIVDAAVRILVRQLPALERGAAPRRPQDEARASVFPRRRPEDGAFPWEWPARRIHDLVRAVTHPYPGARTTLAGRAILVWRTAAGDAPAPGVAPGSLRLHDDRLLVSCGDGRWLAIVHAQLEGEREGTGAELAARLAAACSPTPSGP